MSKATETLRTLGIFNAHDYAKRAGELGAPDVYINFTASTTGRVSRGAYVSVFRPGYKTDSNPNAWWGDYGNKTFSVLFSAGASASERRKSAEAEAIQYANERYGLTDNWVKGPFLGTWVHADTKRAMDLWVREQERTAAAGQLADATVAD